MPERTAEEFMQHVREASTWQEVEWPAWVVRSVRDSVADFYGPHAGRTPAEWVSDAARNKAPEFGTFLTAHDFQRRIVQGRFVFCWNNVGRLINEAGDVAYIGFENLLPPEAADVKVIQTGPLSRIEYDPLTGLYSGMAAQLRFDGIKTEREALLFTIERLNSYTLETLSTINALKLAEAAHEDLFLCQQALAQLYLVGQRIEAPAVSRPAKAALDKTSGGPDILCQSVEGAGAGAPSISKVWFTNAVS